MTKGSYILLFLALPLFLTQCHQTNNDGHDQMMGGDQMSMMMENQEQRQAMMGRMMQNPEARRAMMGQMAQNPEMRQEMMRQMRSSMMSMDQDEMLDRMEQMLSDPERRQQMITHMQQMQKMLDSGDFDREQIREMMRQSPMMGMHMRCMQMMQEPGLNQDQD